MEIFRFWVYSNIHIAIIAAALSFETNYLLHIDANVIAPLFVFFATLSIYNFGYFKAIFSAEQAYRRQARWMKSHMAYWAFSILISLLGLLYLITLFNFWGIIIIACFGIIAMIYVLHRINVFGKSISIRSIPFVKAFIVAITWSAITILPQVINSSYNLFGYNWEWLFFERFFFILSITLMFDVRDLNYDSKELRTFPQTFGINRTKWLSVVFLGLALVCLNNIDLAIDQRVGVIILYLITLAFIYKSNPDNDDIYYTGWFDGVMGLHAIVIIAPAIWI